MTDSNNSDGPEKPPVPPSLDGVKRGDDSAIARVFELHFDELVRIAKKRMDGCRAGSDEEDAAMSAMRTFVRRIGQGQYDGLVDHNHLIRLLTVIAIRKASNHRRRNKRYKHISNIDDESSGNELLNVFAVESGPIADQIAIVYETLEQMLLALESSTFRKIALLQLEGHTNPSIAGELGISLRSVQRKAKQIQSVLSAIEERASQDA